MSGTAADKWAALQSGRGIPADIRSRVDWNPFQHDVARFVPPTAPAATPSRAAALAFLTEPGSVLDVGCGGGAATFALADRLVAAIGVDRQQDMLDVFAATAQERDVDARPVLGEWPAVSPEAGRADLVVSHHVLHNVVDLPPFVRALTAAARRGVVVEMMGEHPMAWLDPLWKRFHGLDRPDSATANDAVAVLQELGLDPVVMSWERIDPPRQDPQWVARRLCLTPDRLPEVASALDDLVRPRETATLSWTP